MIGESFVKLLRKEEDKQSGAETRLKGRMAESLVCDLLREAGNEVFQIGYERVLPPHIERIFEKHSGVGNKVRSIPDFFVVNERNVPYLVEVKFRWHPKGHPRDTERLKQLAELWPEVIVAVINCSERPFFRFSKAPFINSSGEIASRPLADFLPLRVTENMTEPYEKLVAKYLSPTLLHPVPKTSSIFEHSMQYLDRRKR